MAAAHVLINELGMAERSLCFETRFARSLYAVQEADGIAIELPGVSCASHHVEKGVEEALGAVVVSSARPLNDPWQVIYELESELRSAGFDA